MEESCKRETNVRKWAIAAALPVLVAGGIAAGPACAFADDLASAGDQDAVAQGEQACAGQSRSAANVVDAMVAAEDAAQSAASDPGYAEMERELAQVQAGGAGSGAEASGGGVSEGGSQAADGDGGESAPAEAAAPAGKGAGGADGTDASAGGEADEAGVAEGGAPDGASPAGTGETGAGDGASATAPQLKSELLEAAAAPGAIDVPRALSVAAQQETTVGAEGSGAQYASLSEAFSHVAEGVVRVVGDIAESGGVTVGAGQNITLIGNGTTVTFTGGGIAVNGGTLSLGDGSAADGIALLDRRANANGRGLVYVDEGGTFALNDGASIKRPDASKGSGAAIMAGSNSTAGNEAHYRGNGGSVEGATVFLYANSDGYIKGGTYRNDYGRCLYLAGHLSEISSSESATTFASKHPSVDAGTNMTLDIRNGGTVDVIDGGSVAGVFVTDGGSNSGDGIRLSHGGHIGAIRGNVDVTAGIENGYEYGYSALRIYDDEDTADEAASSIGSIEGGTYRGYNFGFCSSGNKAHGPHIGAISGGTFYGRTNGLNNNHFASIGTISGGNYYASTSTWRNKEDHLNFWGGGGAWNLGIIDSISGGTFIGGNQGFVNYSSIGSISGGTFTSMRGDWYNPSTGFNNTNWIDYNSISTSYGMQFAGNIGSMSNATITGLVYGLMNYTAYFTDDVVKIGSIKGCNIVCNQPAGTSLATAALCNYCAVIDSVVDTVVSGGYYGIYNRAISSIEGSGVIGRIEGSTVNTTDTDGIGIRNFAFTGRDGKTAYARIDSIRDTKVNLDAPDSACGMDNQGYIDVIVNSAFKGERYGVLNEDGATLNTIVSGTYWGFGNQKVDAETGKASHKTYGYLNKSANPTRVEPGLEDPVGIGRYWGDTDGIGGLDSRGFPVDSVDGEGNQVAANIVFPDGYHLSARTYRLLPSDFVDSAVHEFRYLKKYFTLNYDKNAAAATGHVDSREERADAEVLDIAHHRYLRPGWYFVCWNLLPDGTGQRYDPQDTIVLPEDTTVYAQWAPYRLFYEGNAAGVAGNMDPSAPAQDEYAVSVSENAFSRLGYEFVGFNTRADGTGEFYPAGLSFVLDADQTVYAQWRKTAEPDKGDVPAKAALAAVQAAADAPTAQAGPAIPQTADTTVPAAPAGTAAAAGAVAAIAAVFGRRRQRGRHAARR